MLRLVPLTVFLVFAPGPAADEPSEATTSAGTVLPSEQLRVVVVGSPPFVMPPPREQPEGIAVTLWETFADQLGLPYRYTTTLPVGDGLDAVASGQADLAIGPISITAERAEHVLFSQPFDHGTLSIMTREGGTSAWDRIAPFFTRAFMVGVSILLFVLLIVGVLMWLAERRRNPQHFPVRPVTGIGNGVWFALVTMTTVGYGDRAPVTPLGRVVSGLWMIVAMVTASSLTASFATALTLSQLGRSQIEQPEQLAGRVVAVVEGSAAEDFARRHGASVVMSEDVPAAIAKLRREQVEAVVHDRAVLRYEAARTSAEDLAISSTEFEPRGYGFALAPGTPWVRALDRAILRAREQGLVRRLRERWAGLGNP